MRHFASKARRYALRVPSLAASFLAVVWIIAHYVAGQGGTVSLFWGFVQYKKSSSDLEALLTMLGEWGIVLIIYWELESNRLDRFLEVSFSSAHSKARLDIYKKYCGLSLGPKSVQTAEFLKLLESDDDLRRKCDRELALLERIGSNIPILPPFRRKALRWFPHTVVFLWEILGPYVNRRRQASIPHWAGHFVRLASACLAEVQREGRTELVIRDPDRARGNDITLTAQRLAEMAVELKTSKRGTINHVESAA